MRLRGRTFLLGAALSVVAGAIAGACAYPSVPPPPASVGGGGSCATPPGTYPPPKCDDTEETCTAPTPACPTTPCDSTSPCLAMSQNAADKPADLRLRKLHITAPPALVTPTFLQRAIIDQGVNLKNFCGEGGDGSFSWLVHFDTAAGRVTTGGAPPTTDPFGVGYCFVNSQINGLNVKPATVNVTQAQDGSWSSDVMPKLYVPIYVHGMASNLIILPLTDARVQGVTLSADRNCIGSYNGAAVDSPPDVGAACADQDPSDCQRWHTAGSLGGYITLAEADGVFIQDLQKSLCVLLTRGVSVDESQQHCAKDPSGKILVAGDYCSQPAGPGGCADSFWLAATFAASAAKINDGSQDPGCNGSTVATDAGADGASDGGGTSEASADAEAGAPLDAALTADTAAD